MRVYVCTSRRKSFYNNFKYARETWYEHYTMGVILSFSGFDSYFLLLLYVTIFKLGYIKGLLIYYFLNYYSRLPMFLSFCSNIYIYIYIYI